MDRFGIGKVGLPGFGIGGFRIPAFGSGSGVSHGNQFHESLVDAWFMSGYANGDSPASIRGVKGNELQLRNFAYALDSGFGKYTVDWSTYRKSNIDILYSGLIHKPQGSNGSISIGFIYLTSNIPSYSIKVEGLSYGSIDYYYRNSEGNQVIFSIKQSGIHKLPICYKDGTDGTNVIINILSTDAVTITQLPSAYEGALLFDGVDDYGICTGLPILDDYTLICRREIISIKNSSAVASKRTYPDDVGNFGAFIFERVFASGGKSTYSFGSSNGISEFDSNEVVYQTKTSYNGTTITSSSSNDSNTLCLGANAYNISLGRCQEFSNVAIYYFALYNKSLTIEEIETEKAKLENMWDSKLNKS